jgi:hypothetical protein
MLGTVNEPIEERPLQDVAKDPEHHRGGDHRQEGIKRQPLKRPHRPVHRERHELAVREVDLPHHAEDGGQAERHQAIDDPREGARDDRVRDVRQCWHPVAVRRGA